MRDSHATFDSALAVPFRHRVVFTNECLKPGNATLGAMMVEKTAAPRRAVAFVDGGVAKAWPTLAADLNAYFQGRPGMPRLCEVDVAPSGEACKQSYATAERVVKLVNRHRIDRQSFVISIGGGGLQDAVGYGAAIAHRGCRVVRIATTTLAQGDAAMAVKNGINIKNKKNFVGTFAVPWGVVCDESFLATTPAWSWCGGFSEAVKIALLRDAGLFARIERDAARIAARDMTVAMPVVVRSAELHYKHIVAGGDPFETSSARPLDFGHWAAHRLEGLTEGALPHGQAVAIGVALDTLYSACSGLMPMDDAQRVVRALRELGLPTTHELLLGVDQLWDGLEEFREHLGGQLTITLLRGIGSPVDVHEVQRDVLQRAADAAARTP